MPDGSVYYTLMCIDREAEHNIRTVMYSLIDVPRGKQFASMFEAVFNNTHHGVVICDDKTRIIAANKYVTDSTGYQLHELIGQSTNIFNAGKHNGLFFQELWSEIRTNGFWIGNLLTKTKSGEVFPQELTIQKISTESGKHFYLGFSLNLANRLYRIVDRESGGIELLTQLPSEKVFKSTLVNSVTQVVNFKGPIVVAFTPSFDEDNLLTERKELSAVLAKQDDKYLTGYFGNNIFALSIPAFDCSDANVVQLVASHIQQAFGRIKKQVQGNLFKRIVSGKIGVSIFGVDTDNPKLLIPHALQAMLVHSTSKNRSVNFYDAKIHQSIKRRELLENTVRNAVLSKSLEVKFQPIVCTSTWKIAKFECLCRFPEVNGQTFETQEMIRVTEELNLVHELDRCIAVKAINHLPELQDIFGEDLAVSTNFSLCTQLSVKEVMVGIGDLIRQSGIAPTHITVELTESAYFGSGQNEENTNPLQQLRDSGVSIAIDDFGTGYSSFAYLTGKNFDFLKIDKEFVMNLSVGNREYYIVKMIVELAHILGVKVIAEGVEKLSDIKILTELKVDFLQGYYFSQPVSMNDIMAANAYMENITALKPYTVTSGESANLASIVNRNIPKLEPNLSMSYVKSLFEVSDIEMVAIVDSGQCVGVIDREIYNLHASPTLGTEIEKRSDLEILRRRLVQVMRKPQHLVKLDTPVAKAVEWLKNKKPFPWVVLDQNDHFIGLIGKGEIMDFFSSQYIDID
ncbi:EAL domain-containing protein [Neiella litorisoli]|nr:EAL domain-containing protein [Neiella litorisoli]